MLAGYETSSTTLAYAAYVLAVHPEEQKYLYDEIAATIDFNVVFTNDSLAIFQKI